jgi:hypothetical protein
MFFTYNSHDTRAVTIIAKEVVKPFSVLDFNQSMIEVKSKDQPFHSYLSRRE